jgi:hypothetical protein
MAAAKKMGMAPAAMKKVEASAADRKMDTKMAMKMRGGKK